MTRRTTRVALRRDRNARLGMGEHARATLASKSREPTWPPQCERAWCPEADVDRFGRRSPCTRPTVSPSGAVTDLPHLQGRLIDAGRVRDAVAEGLRKECSMRIPSPLRAVPRGSDHRARAAVPGSGTSRSLGAYLLLQHRHG